MMPKHDFDTIESGGVTISKRQLSNRNASGENAAK
jgi:hypothetical protein